MTIRHLKFSYIIISIILFLICLPVISYSQSKPRNYNRKAVTSTAKKSISKNYNRKKPVGRNNFSQSKINYKRKRGPIRTPYQNRINNNNHVDFGILSGACNSLTDIGGNRKYSTNSFLDMQVPTTKFAPGAFGRYKFSPYMALSGVFCYGRISGADSLSENTSRSKRGFYFNNDIYEFSARAEFYIPSGGKKGRNLTTFFNYYFFTGAAAFYHFPSLGGPNRADLNIIKSLPRNFGLYQLAIPVGAGFQFNIKNYWKVGYEVGWRMTFTDYLDGFTRPASKHNDSYIFTTINISYAINLNSRYRAYVRKMTLPKLFKPH